MFGMLGGSSSLFGGRQDPDKERPAPPLPTSISFPNVDHDSQAQLINWTEADSPDFYQQYVRIRRPADVTIADVAILNAQFMTINSPEDLFSDTSYLPPRSWLDTVQSGIQAQFGNSQNTQSRALSTGRTCPTQDDFATRCEELQHENQDAFRALVRQSKNGQPPPRLSHFRRFWEALDNMGYYWDASSDEYIPPRPQSNGNDYVHNDSAMSTPRHSIDEQECSTIDDEAEPRKRTKPNPGESITPSETRFPHRPVHSPISSSSATPARTRPPELPVGHPSLNKTANQASRIPEGTYRGHRVGNGAGMPEQHRVDAVRAFIEPIAWAFGFALTAHRRPPIVKIKELLVPMKLSSAVWRPPKLRDKARQGWLEGPVMGLCCRSETEFSLGRADPNLDILKELGALLLLAQERAREGRKEDKPGEGKWWTTVPRWGGNPGDSPTVDSTIETSLDKDVSRTAAATEALIDESDAKAYLESRSQRLGGLRQQAGKGRRATAAENWKTLKPGGGFWDPRVDYVGIGRPDDLDYDEVYLVSSLNHHISVVKLRVHMAYLEYLNSGVNPTRSLPSDWCSPAIQRTKWLDLFDTDDRQEAMRTIWGIMGYLARATDGGK